MPPEDRQPVPDAPVDLCARFRLIGPIDSPRRVQAAVDEARRTLGFESAMQLLLQWCLLSGYLPAGIFEADDVATLADPRTGTPFLLQVNRSRGRYKSPAAGFSRDQAASDCPLCIANVGRPGKELLRVYEFELADRAFFIQHTPFPLHRGHFALIERDHQPMRMDGRSLSDLRAFLRLVPSWTACSNSDIMWAGASILAHHHYQVFPRWSLPVMQAPEDAATVFTAPGGAHCAMLDYPAGVMRVRGAEDTALEAAERILMGWKASVPGKATANVAMHRVEGGLAIHLMLRHSDHRTREDLLAFKKEGVGVLEIAGMVIVPEPTGDGAGDRVATLRSRGLEIVHGIIASNSPLRDAAARRQLAREASQWAGCGAG